jgi:hypothetical protein
MTFISAELHNICTQTQNSKLKTQNSKLKTQNSKLKTQNSKLKTQNSKLKTQNLSLDRVRQLGGRGRTSNGSAGANGERLFVSVSVRVGVLSSLMPSCFSWASLLAG